jgi:hypothetical protein
MAVYIGLKALFQRSNPKKPDSYIRRLFGLLIPSDAKPPEATQAFDLAWQLLKEFMQYLDLDEKHNKLLQTVREVRERNDLVDILPSVDGVRRFRETAHAVIPWLADAQETPTNAWLRGGDSGYINRYISAIGACLLLANRHDDSTQARLAELRSGDTATILLDLHRMKLVGEHLATRGLVFPPSR